MEPKAKVTKEGAPELLRHAAQKLQTIIDKRTELSMMIDELWELVDQITVQLPSYGAVGEIRGNLREDQHHLNQMQLEDVENAIDELRHEVGWGMDVPE